jgi:hypothetical protein
MVTFKTKGLGDPPSIEDASENLSAPETAPAASEMPPAPSFRVVDPSEQADTAKPHQGAVLPRRRQPKATMNLRVPLDFYDELRDFTKQTDIPMTEVLVDGARTELARLKKKYGIAR